MHLNVWALLAGGDFIGELKEELGVGASCPGDGAAELTEDGASEDAIVGTGLGLGVGAEEEADVTLISTF